jgi:hypothetical protein
MKEALAVVRVGFETEASNGTIASHIQKSRSIPRLAVDSWSSGNVTINQDTGIASLALSGRVDDDAAGLYQTSSLQRVYVYRGDDLLGSIPLQAVSDSSSEWKPYAKHFTFSGSVSMPAWDGEHQLAIMTDPNQLGGRGVANASISLSAAFPNPFLTNNVTITTDGDLDAATVDVVTLADPDNTPGATTPVRLVTLTETSPLSLVFVDAITGYQIAIAALSAEEMEATVTQSGTPLHNGFFLPSGNTWVMTDFVWQPITQPTTMTYRAEWDTAWSNTAPASIRFRLPEHLVGSGAAPVVMTETLANSKAFTGTVGTTPILLTFGSGGAGDTSMSISLNGTFIGIGAAPVDPMAGAGTIEYSTVLTKDGPLYRLNGVTAISATTSESTWEPYRVRIDGPDQVVTKLVQERSWTHNGTAFEVFKQGDSWFLKGDDNNPQLAVDPEHIADNPEPPEGDGPNGGAADNPKDDGQVVFFGTVPGCNLHVTATVPAKDVGDQGTIDVTVTVAIDRKTVSDVSPHKPGWEYVKAPFVTLDESAGSTLIFTGTLSRDKAQALAANVAGVTDILDPRPILSEEIEKIHADKLVAWTYASNPDNGGEGWVYNAEENPELSEIIPLWTLPGAPSPQRALGSAVIEAIYGTIGGPENDQERYLVNCFSVKVARGEICHWVKDEGKSVFTWMKDNVFDPAVEKSQATLKSDYIQDKAFNFKKALNDYNNANHDDWTANNAERLDRSQASTFVVDWSRAQQPATYANVLRYMGSFGDPFAWAAVLSGGAPITLAAASEATWVMVRYEGAFLAIDFIPGGKFITKGLKALKGKTCFRRAGLSELPAAEKAAEETIQQIAKRSKVWTKTDEAVFWSGITKGKDGAVAGGEQYAKNIAGKNGGKTLEMILEERGIPRPTTDAEWLELSKDLARNASGEVKVVLGSEIRANATWLAEKEILLNSPKVTKIGSSA